jgi:hypothetical protein
MDERELARRLACSRETLRRHRRIGIGPPFHRIGKLVRYAWHEVQAWLAVRRVAS